MSTLLLPGKREGIIKDPVHDFIPITEIEKEVIDTVPVQRLRRIKQLAGVEYVYPGGIHTRLEHVFGSMHLAGLLASELSLSKEIELDNDTIQLLRLAGLLHDVGHGPFSHVFEGILEKKDRTHEDYTTWIIRESENLKMFVEFYFPGMKRAGNAPREFARRLLEDCHFSILAIGEYTKDRKYLKINNVDELMDLCKGERAANLFLERGQAFEEK